MRAQAGADLGAHGAGADPGAQAGADVEAHGAGVDVEPHSCMTLRGVRAHGAKTVTSALLGTLRADPRSRAEFFALAGVPR